MMTINIPDDSFLNHWVTQFENTEVWPSWRVAIGLGIVGAVLGRGVCFPYGEVGEIWPNMSVLLIGDSGDGKDTIIKPAERVMDEVGVPFIAGKTIEAVKQSLHSVGNPAIGYISAKELSEFLGSKDYQAGIVQSLTDLLSTGAKVDITTKGDLKDGVPRWIYNPTLTMFAGSTPEWLQTGLPPGSLEGGFLPRFVVVTETNKAASGIRMIPNPGEYENFEQRQRVFTAKQKFIEAIQEVKTRFNGAAVRFTDEESGRLYYNNWYINRFRHFSPTTRAYANRSAGLMRKVAMLMAVTRGHSWVEEVDYEFASELILHAAGKLERSVIAVSKEVTIGDVVVGMIPCKFSHVLAQLSPKYGPMWVKRAVTYLIESGQARLVEGELVRPT